MTHTTSPDAFRLADAAVQVAAEVLAAKGFHAHATTLADHPPVTDAATAQSASEIARGIASALAAAARCAHAEADFISAANTALVVVEAAAHAAVIAAHTF